LEYTKNMLVGEVIRSNPDTVEVLLEMGLGCVGCPGAQMESLEEAAMVHALDLDTMLKKLNAVG
jgi:hybrid cluster-associated redox disulfide protein